MNRVITDQMTVRQIMDIVPMNPARYHIDLGPETWDKSLAQLCAENPDWILTDMCDGLNRLLEIAMTQDRFVYPIGENNAKTSIVHFPVDEEAPFVLICAGGAYCCVASAVEAFPIAAKLNKMGYHAFVLEYRCGKVGLGTQPMEDLAAALTLIFNQRGQFHVTSDYAVCGMSAGGHLALSLCATSMRDIYANVPKPGAVILGYPVVSMGKYAHKLSKRMLLGDDPEESEAERFSFENQISAESPPVYVWLCAEDATVPAQNSIRLSQCLRENSVNQMIRIYEGKAHGWALGTGTEAHNWLTEAMDFWREAIDMG